MSVFSAKAQRKAIGKAANIQRESTDKILAQNEEFFRQQQENIAPSLALGKQATGILSEELSKPITASESFKFAEDELQKTLDRRLASLGAFNSGSNIRESINLKQRLIGSEIGRRDRLISSALGIGQSATGQASREIGLQSSRQGGALRNLGTTLSSAEIAKGKVSSDMFKGLTDLTLQGLGALTVNPAAAAKIPGNRVGAPGINPGGFNLS